MNAIEILLVEDNPADAKMVMKSFGKSKVANTIHYVFDGVEALAFLRREGTYQDKPVIDIVLLDIRLPGLSGLEVLEQIRQDPKIASLPVIILTSSESDEDVLRGYKHHVNNYITKPVTPEGFQKALLAIGEFWLTYVKLPRGKAIGS